MAEKDGWSGIERGEGRCSACGAGIDPAEESFAVLATEEGSFRRRDLCGRCFQALPARPVSFWKRAPKKAVAGGAGADRKGERRAARARDLDALLELFGRLGKSGAEPPPDAPGDGLTPDERAKLRYILALALVRRKRLELVDLAREGGADCLILRATGEAELVTISAPKISESDLARLSREIEAEIGLS